MCQNLGFMRMYRDGIQFITTAPCAANELETTAVSHCATINTPAQKHSATNQTAQVVLADAAQAHPRSTHTHPPTDPPTHPTPTPTHPHTTPTRHPPTHTHTHTQIRKALSEPLGHRTRSRRPSPRRNGLGCSHKPFAHLTRTLLAILAPVPTLGCKAPGPHRPWSWQLLADPGGLLHLSLGFWQPFFDELREL